MPRPKLRDDGVPTRCDTSLMSPAELAITAAMVAVENAGGSVALTDAVTLLSKARDRVADHVEADQSVSPNFCQSCSMDIETCDCVEPRPTYVARKV